MNRIDALFSRLKKEGKKTFIPYITAGDPSLEQTVDLVLTLEQAGASLVELGVPFSDPLADGVANQLGAQRALGAGTTPQGVLKMIKKLREEKKSEIPIVLYIYFNLIFRRGAENFLKEAETSGVDGVLPLDLPPEEAAREWPQSSSLKRISLIAPTTPPERIQTITANSSGFIYYVSRTGVTGMRNELPPDLEEKVSAIRQYTDLPICIGFGISNPNQARAAARVGDGVVIGSAIVNQIAQHGKSKNLSKKILQFTQPIAEAVKSA